MKRVNVEKPPLFKGLFYGAPGSFKTRTAASAALDDRMFPVLQLDHAGNPVSFTDYARKPDVIEIEQLSDFNGIYEWLRLGQPDAPNGRFAKLIEDMNLLTNGPYKTVIVDTITDVQRASFGKVTGNEKIAPGDIPQQVQLQHYGSVLAHMTMIARSFFRLPIHVIITAQELEKEDQTTGRTMIRPMLLGQSATEVASYAYVVARMMHRGRVDSRVQREIARPDPKAAPGSSILATDTTNVAMFKPSLTWYAKDQYGALGDMMENPTMTRMMDAIYK